VLRELGVPWSLFVVTDWAAGRHRFGDGMMLSWREIARLADDGVEIGSHSVTHPDFGTLDRASAQEELEGSKHALETEIGIRPSAFAIPLGCARNWTSEAQAIALSAGYKVVLAQAEARRSPGTAARTFVTKVDGERIFRAALRGAFDNWEETV
jgi:peptidoglycan/xylan/chitin deacetylase (PgdA/CDA1 family)